MSEDRTSPMRVPPKPRRDQPQGDQDTISSDQDSSQSPTIHVPGGGAAPGFVRAVPSETPTPQPQGRPPVRGMPPPPPYQPPMQPPAAPQDATLVISARTPPVFAWLVVIDAPDRASIGEIYTLRPDTTTVGRAASNHIVLSDGTCSSQHFRIRAEAGEGEEMAWVLYDMGSSNGTFVGDRQSYTRPESQTYRHRLQDGDYVLVGETTLVFKKI